MQNQSNKKRILFVGHEVSRTGAPRSLLNIATIAVNLGYEVKFIIGNNKNEEVLEEYKKVGEVFIWYYKKPYRRYTRKERLIRKFYKPVELTHQQEIMLALQQYRPNLIFNNTIVNGAILEELSSLQVPIVSRIPELETVIQKFNIQQNNSALKVIQYSQKIVAVSQAVKNNLILQHQVNENDINIIYGFVKNINTHTYIEQRHLIRNELNVPSNAFVVGNCSSLIYRKGFDFFLELATEINKLTPMYFVWVGGKKQSEIFIEVQEEVKKRNLSEYVKFIGEQNNVYKYLAAFDVFFHSSREEPFSLAMLEAAQFKLPILGFKQTGGVEEFLANGGGILADFANVHQFIEPLISMKNNPEHYARLSQESFKNANTYNEDTSALAWTNYFKTVIK